MTLVPAIRGRRFEAADVARLELIAFVTILALAAALRLTNLSTRGTWDADQGHDMLVLRDLVRSGVVPLLGPPTSIGDFHHGMLYYLLLAPAAAVSNADPTGVTAWIALGGIVAVGVTGWLGRAIGGPLAGLIAALLMAVSASAVEESTFIWNPNVIALSSSIALAASWQAWQSGRARWWVIAGVAAVVTMHCHVLGVVLSPVVGSLLLADLRLRRRVGDRAAAARVARAGVAWIVLLALSYVPLAIHELSSNASELRAAVAFLLGGGGPAAVALPVRLPIIALRVLGWPLVGLLTDAPALSLLAGALVVAVAVWCGWFPDRGASERGDQGRVGISTDPAFAVRWLALGLAWTIVALAIGASSLATVVIGLPNDHYHAFADPIVFVLVGIGLARLIQLGVRRRERAAEITSSAATRPAPIGAGLAGLAGLAVAFGLVVWNVARQPPAVAADGGWPAAEAAAGRVVVATAGAPLSLTGLPAVKPVDAVRFPLEELVPGSVVDAATAAAGGEANVTTRVILCDQLFHETIGADCGGPAEDQARSAETGQPTKPAFLIDRFEAAPGRWISVYRPTPSK